MARPLTLFTGQWADLPFEEVCKLASEWGYEGLEIACWGDHFEVDKALADEAYIPAKLETLAKYGLKVWAISNHLLGQAVCDNPIGVPNSPVPSSANSTPAVVGNAGTMGILPKLAPVGSRARHLLAENLGAAFGAQLLKLRVERLTVGADAGIAEASFLLVIFGHILRKL